MQYVVASLNVLGNEDNGWELNDEHRVGTIDLHTDILHDDDLVIDVLTQSDYLDGNVEYDVVGDDFDRLTIEIAETGRPVFALILQG